MKKAVAFLLALVMVFALCACGMEQQTITIDYGESKSIELSKEYADVDWQSSDASIVTVINGTLKGEAPGSAIVSALSNGKKIAEISVSVNLVDITGIFLNQEALEIAADETATLKYSLVPETASDYGLSWKSVNEDIATVDANGNISAVSPGTTTILCSSSTGIMATCEVTVKAPSAIEQLNEYEKWVFDVLIEKLLPSFYNAPVARIKKLGPSSGLEDYEKNMLLDVEIQGQNRLGGTLYKDYALLCVRDIKDSTYLPCFTDDGLFKSPHEWYESTKIDYAKINLALDEYWNSEGM